MSFNTFRKILEEKLVGNMKFLYTDNNIWRQIFLIKVCYGNAEDVSTQKASGNQQLFIVKDSFHLGLEGSQINQGKRSKWTECKGLKNVWEGSRGFEIPESKQNYQNRGYLGLKRPYYERPCASGWTYCELQYVVFNENTNE